MSTTTGAHCPVCAIHAESVFRVQGLCCQEEVGLLDRRLRHLPGVEDFAADVMTGRLRIAYDATRLTPADLTDAVATTGMRAWLENEQPAPSNRPIPRTRVALVMVSGLAFLGGLGAEWGGFASPWSLGSYAVSILAGAAITARRALGSVRALSLDINVLMLVAVAGAVVIGEWSEASAVIFLFALAQWLETRSMERARHAIRALMELAPSEAVVLRAGAERRLKVADVAIGDTLIVRPGERIALDGVVTGGTSEVNQAPITGESLPVDKGAGAEVFAGTINGHGALDIRVTKRSRDTTMARIIGLVEVAQAQRAPSQAFVERFSRYYTPAVLVAAVGVAVVPPLAFGQPLGSWFYRALVLLVISCPCALVISTPVSIVSALAGAARRGVLVKGGVHLERTADVKAVAFDKTGTLTHGRPEVADVIPLNGVVPARILSLAAALEARSEHPIARAIVDHADRSGASWTAGEGFQALPGRGAEARVGDTQVLVGNHRLFEERGLCSPDIDDRLRQLGRDGRTAVLVASQGLAIGIIGVADRTRETAKQTVSELRRQGIRRVVLLTGDNEATARAIAAGIGADDYRAELLPADKVAEIAELRRRYGTVAMVGDGVNDAPALAAADVGVAMGVAGSDAALETADVALMSDDLLKLPYLLRLGRRTRRSIQVNVAIALGLKGLFLVLAVAGAATLWMAVVADMGASLLVLGNGMRLLRSE